MARQWELDHPLSVTSSRDMGLGATTPGGAPSQVPAVYDIDGFDNPASTVGALHARHAHVICYIEVGAAETYRPDFPLLRASGPGRVVADHPDEY